MPPKKQRSISSRSDQQPFMVNLEMEVEEEMEDDINNNEVISSTEESSSSSSSDYSNSLETNSTDACSPSPPSTTSTSTSSSSSSSPPSFISIPSTAIKSDDIIPAISIISPTPTEPKEVLRTGLGAGAAPRFAFPSNKSADQPKPKSLFEIGDEESEDSTTENRTLNLTETEERENGVENPKISKSQSRCCGNGCTKIGENPKNSHRRRSPSFSTLSSDDSTSLENGDRKNNLECICLEMCPITTTTTKTERKTSAEEEDQNGEEVENAPHHDDLTTEEKEEKEKEEPGRLLTTTAHTHRRNRSTHHRHHYHHRYHQHHQHPPPTPLPLLCNQQVSLYGPEQQSPAGAFVGSEQQQQLFSSKESLSSTSSAAAAAAQQQHQQHQHHQHQQKPAPQSAIMPMAINSMDKCSKLWRNDPTEPFPAKARPKPIKFEIPSAAKTMASYFRLPSPVSPAVSAGQQTPQTGGLYSIGSEPIINHGFEPEEEEEEEVSPGRGRRPLATLQVSQTLPPSASLASFSSVAAHSNLSSPEASRTPFSPNIGGAQHSPAAPAMTNFVPIYISAKDLEAAFLGGGGSDQAGGGPPPQYTSAEQLQQKKKVVQLANLSATPSAYNSLNAKHRNSAVKRTKSFQERIQRALWGGTNGEGDGDPLPPPKAALCARMSILGKPLKQPRNRSLHLMRQRVWLYNFLQRPRGVLAYAYHLAVAITIILNLLFFALSTVSYLEPQSMNALRALDIIILSILTLELLALCWASSCVGKYQGWQGKFRFIFLSPFRLLDLLIIGVTAVVVWTCWLNSHQDYLQWLRCGMIFQILRLENRFKPWRMLSSVLWIERKHLLITVYMGFLILVTISYVVFFLEQEDPETLFTNIPVSLYWGVITVCTIGYGDMAPKTTAGRTVGALLAICGAVIYAIPAGIIATGLALKVQERNREKHINKRRIPAVRLIQCAWRCYAASANSTSSVTWWVAQKAVASGGNRGGGGFHRKLMDMYNGSQFSLMEDHHQHHSDHHHNGDHHQHNNHSTAASKQNSHSDLHALNLESGGGGGGGILSGAQKNAVRFIRAAQYEVALREFKNAFKPYDIKDVLQQYSEGHADVVGRVRCMQSGINAVHVALGGVMKMMAEMQHRQTEKIDRLEATVERLLRRLQEAEGDGGEGGDGHQGGNGNGHHHPPNSPYHSYSETSTIYARTPTLAQQPLHPPPPPPPPPPTAPPTSSKEDEENSFNEVRTRHQNQQQQQQQQPPHHHSRNNSS